MNKNTNILHEINSFFREKEGDKPIRYMIKAMEQVGVDGRLISNWKASNCQFTPVQILHMLILLPFFGIKSIASFAKSEVHRICSADDNVLYDFLGRDDIKWRKILSNVTRRIIRKVSVREDHVESKNPTCLIFDDTDFMKVGKHFELIGRIWSHVKNASVIGYKALFCCLTDGVTTTAYDFSLHGEKGKNADKLQGFSAKDREARYSKTREKDGPIAQRISEYFESKIQVVIRMIRKAINDGVDFEYVLTDSWFTCKELVAFVKSRHKKHFLGMIKMSKTQYVTDMGTLTASTIVSKMTGKARKASIKISRKLGMRYFEVAATLGETKVKLFFFSQGKNGEWKALLSTNTALDAIRAY